MLYVLLHCVLFNALSGTGPQDGIRTWVAVSAVALCDVTQHEAIGTDHCAFFLQIFLRVNDGKYLIYKVMLFVS